MAQMESACDFRKAAKSRDNGSAWICFLSSISSASVNRSRGCSVRNRCWPNKVVEIHKIMHASNILCDSFDIQCVFLMMYTKCLGVNNKLRFNKFNKFICIRFRICEKKAKFAKVNNMDLNIILIIH